MSQQDDIRRRIDEARVPLRERVERGDFEPKSPRPAPKRAYNRAEYERALGVYKAEKAGLILEFNKALCEEYEVPPDSTFGKLVIQLAWDRGHSNDFLEVMSEFEDLLPLWHEAEKMVQDEADRHP